MLPLAPNSQPTRWINSFQAKELQIQRAADALYASQHQPEHEHIGALAAQQEALVSLGDRLNQGTAIERVAAWKQVILSASETSTIRMWTVYTAVDQIMSIDRGAEVLNTLFEAIDV